MSGITTTSIDEEYLRQYATIIAINNNVCPAVLYILSQLNSEYYAIMAHSLEKLRNVYYDYAPAVKRAYHRHLLSRHVEYTGTCIRTVPIPNMMGVSGGIRFLDTDPPLFTRDFLRDRTPALVNICILTNAPVEFYYRIGLQDSGTITSGRVVKSDYVALPPRANNEVDNNEANFLPGRYFLDLNIVLSVNPLLFHELICPQERIIMTVAQTLIWYDHGNALEPILRPDIRMIMNHFTHFIAQFKTTPTALVDPLHMRLNAAGIRNPKKFPMIIDDRKFRPRVAEVESDEESNYLLTADDLLGVGEEPIHGDIYEGTNDYYFDDHSDHSDSISE